MAITQSALARAMARDVVRAAPPEARIKRIWAWSEHGRIDPRRDYVHLWFLADPADEVAEQALLVAINRLAELYPDVNIGAGTFDPDSRVEDLRDWMHPDALEIDLGLG